MTSWQDISTAPRDGTSILLAGRMHATADGEWWARVCRWRQSDTEAPAKSDWCCDPFVTVYRPLLWQPITFPEPPHA